MINIHSVSVRIGAVVVLAILALAGTGYLGYTDLRSSLMAQKKVELADQVQTVKTMIEGFRDRAAKGEMSVEEAQAAAKAVLRTVS